MSKSDRAIPYHFSDQFESHAPVREQEMIVDAARIECDVETTTITFPIRYGTHSRDVWFQIRGAKADATGATAVAMTLVPAMKVARRLRVANPVSPKLLSTLPKIQEIFPVWNHRFEQVPVLAPMLDTSLAGPANGVGVFFSGGVDSFFSLLRHFNEITHLIFVRGFDIRLDNRALAEEVLSVIRSVAEEVNKPLIEVTTNLRDFSDELVAWGADYHGSALASVALLLAPVLRKAYIASTHPYSALFPWGSHPLLDYRWSTETVEIDHDGCDATRVKKVAVIANSPTVQRTLRVCYRNKNGAYNCGRCEKCLRTMVNLRVAGALEQCRTFKRPLRLGEVRLINVKDENTASFVIENLRAAEATGDDPALVRALRQALSRRFYRGPGHLVRPAIDLINRLQRKFEQ